MNLYQEYNSSIQSHTIPLIIDDAHICIFGVLNYNKLELYDWMTTGMVTYFHKRITVTS